MSAEIDFQTSVLVERIKKLQPFLDKEASRIRCNAEINEDTKFDRQAWCRSAMGDSLVKLRLFTEQNFNYIESMGILAVTRYIFEMSVWLLLFKMDSRYGLVYSHRLIDTQIRYWKDCRTQVEREISLFKKIEIEEQLIMKEKIEKLEIISDLKEKEEATLNLTSTVMNKIDSKASRHFSLYIEQAKINGYSFQAHLIEKNTLVKIHKSILELEVENNVFMSSVPPDIKSLIPKRWNWCDMAKKTGLYDEYDYIYSCTSKLLHATPSSITTNQKNLELSEINVFLKYIHVKIQDVLELARQYP